MQLFFKLGKFNSKSKQLSLLELIKTLNPK